MEKDGQWNQISASFHSIKVNKTIVCHVPGYENQVVGHSEQVVQIKDLQVFTVLKKRLQGQKSITKNMKLSY